MRYQVHLGRIDSAIAQYRQCRTVLGREFGVEPMPETQQLYQQVLARRRGNDGKASSLRLAVKPTSRLRGC